MGIVPEHIPGKQEDAYKWELRRKGLLKIYIVVTEPYDRYGAEDPTQVELYEALNITQLVKELGYDSVKEFHDGNGDGSDFCTIKELKLVKKGKEDCKCTRYLKVASVWE